MNTIRTIDLWTEQHINHYECFNGAFVDGFEEEKKPFDEYKVVKNCNCLIECNDKNINISNKHNAILFYKEKIPVRLMVVNKDTEINHCIEVSLNQYRGGGKTKRFVSKFTYPILSYRFKRNPNF